VKKNYYLHFNYLVASFLATLNIGMARKIRFLQIVKTSIAIRFLKLFYNEGIIRTFVIKSNIILVYFKYIEGRPFIKRLTIISTPGNRIYWTLNTFSRNYSNDSFSGFYVISTPRGLVTTDYCLLHGRSGGEILVKVILS